MHDYDLNDRKRAVDAKLEAQKKAFAPIVLKNKPKRLFDIGGNTTISYSLHATSLYFTCMANGNSMMYRCGELTEVIERAGFEMKEAHHNLGENGYSLLRFRKTT